MAFHVVFTTVVLCLTALSVSGHASPWESSIHKSEVTEPCLACICEAIGDCLPSMKCTGEVCGMFGITWPYWSDSGKPVVQGSNPHDSDAYKKCALDPVCAKKSVIAYMDKYAQDCNNDGAINCFDYAAIHKLGRFGCKGNLPKDYESKFLTCQSTFKSLSG